MDYWAKLAYEAADAMLRERERVAEMPESQHAAGTCRGERHDAAAGVTLTDAEREAVRFFSQIDNGPHGQAMVGLLARLGGGA